MDQISLYRLLGDEYPMYIIKDVYGNIRVISNWDIYLANTAK